MNQEKGRRRDSEEKAEEKGKSFLSFFKAYEKKMESNSAHNGTRNITGAKRIGRTNCVIATAFVGNAPPHAIPLVSYRWSAVYFLLLMTEKIIRAFPFFFRLV